MGGLFTGIALDGAGHDVLVAEQSDGALRSRGGGIVAQPSIQRFLDRYDVVDPESITTTTSERRFLAADGSVERSMAESMTFTSWDALYRRLRGAFPDERYRTGKRVADVEPATARVAFADGTERAADLVVAAEGGQSATRDQLFPAVEADFADYVAWRGVVPEADLPASVVDAFDNRFMFYDGPEMLALAYFIPGADGETTPDDRRLNWVWYDTLSGRDERAIFTDAGGTERTLSVPPGQLQGAVERRQRERAETLPPAFTDLVDATTEPFVQRIYDLRVPKMCVDRVCLLGDAAFVARPHTAAGTAKAAEDGVELAAALEASDSVETALDAWDDARSGYGERLVTRGERMGDERLGLGG